MGLLVRQLRPSHARIESSHRIHPISTTLFYSTSSIKVGVSGRPYRGKLLEAHCSLARRMVAEDLTRMLRRCRESKTTQAQEAASQTSESIIGM
jgi:hypothetical protein